MKKSYSIPTVHIVNFTMDDALLTASANYDQTGAISTSLSNAMEFDDDDEWE